MNPCRCDLAVLGAGCFATLLVQRLRGLGWNGRVVLVDRRLRFDQAQRWCWWRHRNDPPANVDGITREWSRYVFRTGKGRWQSRELRHWSYVHVDARRFFAAAHAAWQADEGIDLRPGVTAAGAIRRPDGRWSVSTSAGELDAAMVVDCRSLARQLPRQEFAPGDGWWQSFAGRVLPEAAAPLDERTFCLMDLDAGTRAALGFGYLLGLGDGDTLVEYTMFDSGPVDRRRLNLALDDYLQRLGHGSGSARVLDEEHGWLPMTAGSGPAPSASAGIDGPLRAGLAGGAARPASGYAFGRMMRQASVLARALTGGEDPAPALARAHHVWIDRLDGVFLRTLGCRPELARPSFARLLEGLTGDQLASFMAERPSPATLARVLCVLPKRPFLQGAWRQWRRRNEIAPAEVELATMRRAPS